MKFNLIVTLIFQFVVSLIFITAVMFYFSILLMIPLALVTYAFAIGSLFSSLALQILVVAGLLGSVGYLGLKVFRMTELVDILLGVGVDLVEFGFKQNERFGPLIEQTRAKIA